MRKLSSGIAKLNWDGYICQDGTNGWQWCQGGSRVEGDDKKLKKCNCFVVRGVCFYRVLAEMLLALYLLIFGKLSIIAYNCVIKY